MEYKEFIDNFKKWRAKEDNPNTREYCRNVFRDCVRLLESNKRLPNDLKWAEFIYNCERQSRLIDSLYRKGLDLEEYSFDDKYFTEKSKVSELDIKYTITNTCYEYIKENNCMPSFNMLKKLLNIKVSSYFADEKELYNIVKKIYTDVNSYMLNEDTITKRSYRSNVNSQIKSHKKFFITTAVSDKKLNRGFYNSIKSYIEKNDALCIILPSADVANRRDPIHEWVFPPELSKDGFCFVYEDTYLNSNIYISDIKISAKQINPLTGLAQYTQDASVIVASPKQILEFVPTIYKENKLPRAIMSTGAITENDYSTDYFMTKRISKIAETDHIVGGIIVEIDDENYFHFRQVQCDETGSFIDLGVKYFPDKEPVKVDNSILIVGDSHFGEHDIRAIQTVEEMINVLNIKDIVLHDVFTGLSINHHEQKNAIMRAYRADNEQISLEKEIDEVAFHLDRYASDISGKVYIVDSNHHDFINKYLSDGMFIKDSVNAVYACDVFKYVAKGNLLPLKYMIERSDMFNSQNKNKYKWLKPNDSLVKFGYELAMHGHKGSNGMRGNSQVFRRAFTGSISGHTHTPSIFKNAITVGTTSKLQLSYNIGGLSSWVQNCCVLYPNGTYQLLNMVNKDNNKSEYAWKGENI